MLHVLRKSCHSCHRIESVCLHRNVILDETNVNGSVQTNKWRLFDGFKRRAVVVVTPAETLKERHAKRPAEEIFLSDRTITEMKG